MAHGHTWTSKCIKNHGNELRAIINGQRVALILSNDTGNQKLQKHLSWFWRRIYV